MTVSTSTNSVVYRGNGAATQFAVPFKVLDEDHLRVRRRLFTTGALDYTYIGTDYSYSGIGASSGTLTLAGTVLDDDYELVIERIVPYTQDLDIVNAGGFYPETVEEQLDLITMGVQQLADLVERGAVVPVGEDGLELSKASDRANKFFGFDAAGRFTASAGTGADAGLRTDLGGVNGGTFVKLDDGETLQHHVAIFRDFATSLKQFEQTGQPIGIGTAANDQAAFAAAFDYQMDERRAVLMPGGATAYPAPALYVPPGDYTVTGTLGADLEFLSMWCIPGTVTITIAAGAYFLLIPNRLELTRLTGFRFIGGKGALRHSFTGTNVSTEHEILDCIFYDYTECAVSSDAANMPYWRVRGNQFYCRAASGTTCKGLAIGGLLDNSVIEMNRFLRNDIHLQLGPLNSGNVHVLNNDFLSFEANRTDYDVWLIPSDTEDAGNPGFGMYGTNSGQGTRFVGNKFGNEGITDFAKKAPRMLVAAKTGTVRATCTPDLTWKTGADGFHYLTGLIFSHNRISTASPSGNLNGPDASFMKIYINGMDGTVWDETNKIDGGLFNYLFEFVDAGARQPSKINSSWQVMLPAPLANYGAPFKYGVASSPIGFIEDPHGIFPSACTHIPGFGSDPGEVILLRAVGSASWTVTGTGAKANATDRSGGATATKLTWSTLSDIAYLALPDVTAYANMGGWLVAEYRGDVSTIPNINVAIETSNYSHQLRKHVYRIADDTVWYLMVIPFIIPGGADPTLFRVQVTPNSVAGGANEMVFDTVTISVGRSPPRIGRIEPIVDLAIANVGTSATATDAALAADVDSRFNDVETKVNALITALESVGDVRT